MYNPSPYAIPIGSFRTPVPIPTRGPLAPPLHYVGINCDWFPYITGALTQLLLQATWITNTNDELFAVQSMVEQLIGLFRCEVTPTLDQLRGALGGGSDSDFMIRQNPDNPCIIESSMDGTNWCPFIDLSLCTPSPAQPGDGSEQAHSGGGQVCYTGQLYANGQWLLPTVVSTGDVIDLQDALGVGNGGATLWNCPDGNTFYAGNCISGTGATDSGDPLNTVNHMRLIWKIGSSYFDAMAGPITVGGGVSNEQALLMVNDSVLSDNYGNYTLKVCFTNNQTATFTHTFDFTVDNGGYTVVSFGSWSAGNGWIGQTNSQVTPGREVELLKSGWGSRNLTSLTMFYDRGAGGDGVVTLRARNSGSTVFQYSTSPGPDSGSNLSVVATGSGSANEIYIDINSHPSTTPLTITKVIVEGIGSDPF